jgi:hypothetical protein
MDIINKRPFKKMIFMQMIEKDGRRFNFCPDDKPSCYEHLCNIVCVFHVLAKKGKSIYQFSDLINIK